MKTSSLGKPSRCYILSLGEGGSRKAATGWKGKTYVVTSEVVDVRLGEHGVVWERLLVKTILAECFKD